MRRTTSAHLFVVHQAISASSKPLWICTIEARVAANVASSRAITVAVMTVPSSRPTKRVPAAPPTRQAAFDCGVWQPLGPKPLKSTVA